MNVPSDVPEVWCARVGLVPYPEALALQKRLEAARQSERVPDVLLLLEHPPTYTRGRRSTADELPMGEDWYRAQGIEMFDTDRGGRVTYHGPGQLVGYPVVSLRAYGDDVHDYIRRMEQRGRGGARLVRDRGRHGRGPDRRLDRRAPQDRLDRHPRQPRGHDAWVRDQRQQRPPAVRVDRAVRHRSLPHVVGRPRARTRTGHDGVPRPGVHGVRARLRAARPCR